jgi:DNA-binding NarL/FixJ family response regulator
LTIIRSLDVPLVILDWDENGRDWRDGLSRLSSVHQQICVLLASRVVDDNLREEVLRFHGYDVLAKSADGEQIIRTVQFAWFWITRSTALADRATKKES